jgi:hypothetical protein
MYMASLKRKPENVQQDTFLEVQVQKDAVPMYKPILRRRKSVSFFLPELPPYVFFPGEKNITED